MAEQVDKTLLYNGTMVISLKESERIIYGGAFAVIETRYTSLKDVKEELSHLNNYKQVLSLLRESNVEYTYKMPMYYDNAMFYFCNEGWLYKCVETDYIFKTINQ